MDTLSFYRQLLQNDPNPLVYLNRDFGPEFANEKAREIFSIGSQSENSQLMKLIEEKWKSNARQLKEMVLELPTSSGNIVFRVSINEINEDAMVKGFLLGFTDITEQIKNQQLLIECQRNYGNIFMMSSLNMMVIDIKTYQIKQVNSPSLSFYGYSQNELIGMSFLEIDVMQNDEVAFEIKKAKQNKNGHYITKHILAKGSKVEVEVFLGPLSFLENSDLYVIVFPLLDVESPVLPLLDHDAKFNLLINTIHEAILIQNIGPKGSKEPFSAVNDKASSLLGFSREELLNRSPASLVASDSSIRAFDEIYKKILDRKKIMFEIDLIDKNQHKIMTEFASIYYEFGNQKQIISVVRDVTNRKKIDEIKNEFVNTITHELRTPIAALKGSLYLMHEKGKENLSDVLEIAERNVDRLSSLVNDILDYQKLSLDRLSFHLIEQQINDLILLIADEIKNQLIQKGLHLSLNLDKNLPMLFYDRNRITQVLMNLVHNAIKFTNEGSITLITSQNKDSVIVSVQDTGIGIKKEDIPKLFIPFSQLTDTVDKKGSSGLGLAICKKIIHNIGGSIWVESEFGKGSTFSFSLPKRSFFKSYPSVESK